MLRLSMTKSLLLTGRKWVHISQAVAQNYGLSVSCCTALVAIGRSGEGVNQIAVAEQIGIEGASLVRIIDQLVRSHLIRREKDPVDRRANTLWFTDEGKALMAKIEADLVRLRSLVFKDLPTADLDAVLRVFQAVEAAYHDSELAMQLYPQSGRDVS